MKVNDGDIYNDDYSLHGYYIIKFSSSPYTLQEDLIFNGQAIYSGGMVCEGTYLFPINMNSHCDVLQRTKFINNF